MTNQMYTLIAFFVTGICIGFLFDIFRVTRRIFKVPDIVTYIEDVLFWLSTGILVILTILFFTDGEVRLYMILMTIIGAVLYFMLISKYFIKMNIVAMSAIKKIINVLILPFKKLVKKRSNVVTKK